MTGSVIELSRRLYDEVWNDGRYDVAEQLIHPDFAYAAAPGLRGPEAKLVAIRRHRASAPDLHVHIDELIAQGDTVTVRTTMTGTDTGGLAGRPPTGREFRTWAVDLLGFRDGQIISDWVGVDWLTVFVQLGVVDNPWA